MKCKQCKKPLKIDECYTWGKVKLAGLCKKCRKNYKLIPVLKYGKTIYEAW